MTLRLKIVQNTILKQKPVESSQLSAEDKHSIQRGAELELHSWDRLQKNKLYIRVSLAKESFKGKNTWYALRAHTQVIPSMVKEVQSCSTEIVQGLDKQIIAEMNRLVPGILVSFDDLNVNLGSAVWPYLQPPAKRALERAIANAGDKMTITSAYRTIAQQQILYNHYKNRRCNIVLAAMPSKSNHQSGLALDTPYPSFWGRHLYKYGWRWLGPGDPVHFDYKGSGRRDIRSLSVRAFQRLWNKYNLNDKISEDGAYGSQTAIRLNNSPIEGFAITIGDFRILRLSQPYMQGEDVRKVQSALIKADFSVEVDGFYGPGTVAIVKQFQKQKGLTPDGIVGPATLAKLGF